MSNTETTTTTPVIASPKPSLPLSLERDQEWLENLFSHIWYRHFNDVAELNTVKIKWGRVSRTRLGTITGKGGANPRVAPEVSEIKLNPLLQQPEIPEAVIWQTIAHELAHYTHGFCSPHPRKYANPHRGNVIEKELYSRNMAKIYSEAEVWLKANWHGYVTQEVGARKIRRRRRVYARRKPVSLLSHLKKITSRRRGLGR